MSVSPLVAYPTDVLKTRPISSPLKRQASAGLSSNGTPRAARQTGPAADAPATLDLAEQMNEQEKKKYIKG